MKNNLIVADKSADYRVNEGAIVVVAIGWLIALGSVVWAAIILCGWRGAKQVALDWLRMKATFVCR